MIMCLIHILEYMLRNVFFFFDLSANFRSMRVCVLVRVCVCVCCVHVYVVYEDTSVYNDMGMTGFTRRRGFMRTFSVSP